MSLRFLWHDSWCGPSLNFDIFFKCQDVCVRTTSKHINKLLPNYFQSILLNSILEITLSLYNEILFTCKLTYYLINGSAPQSILKLILQIHSEMILQGCVVATVKCQ